MLSRGLWEIKKRKHRFYYVYCRENKVYMLHACFKQKGQAEDVDLNIGRKRQKEIEKSFKEREG